MSATPDAMPSGTRVPEAWVALPPDTDLLGAVGSWGEPESGLRARLARAGATARNLARLLPPAARLMQTTSRSIGRRFQYDFGFMPAMGRLLMTHRDLGLPFLMTYSRIMFGPSTLTRAEREAIAAVTAAAQDCYY